MHPLEASILEEFRRNPSRTFSTSEMVKELFKEEYVLINQNIHSAEKQKNRQGLYRKAQLHRKLLYHVNKMVGEGLLIVAGVRGKGEKLFRLALEGGELIVQGLTKKIIISKPATITTSIDGYEKNGRMRKYRPENMLNKHNAIMLDCVTYDSLPALQQRLQQLFPLINDAIALDHFERVLMDEQAAAFLQYLALDAHDYDIAVSMLIDYASLESDVYFPVLSQLIGGMPPQLTFVFSATARLLSRKEEEFKRLLALFSEKKCKLTLKNQGLFPPPIFFGRVGPYSFSREDWSYYEQHIKGRVDGCIVGQTSVIIDITRHFADGGTIGTFREMMAKTANALFEIEEQRRKHFADYFGYLAFSDMDVAKEFFKVGRHYIRFWNYDWASSEKYPLVELLGSIKEDIDKFCVLQETIFKSCGLPIRFRIGLSTSFAKFDQDFFSERRYKKTAIATVKDLQTKEAKEYLHIRERLYKTFDGADRLRFFLAPGIPVEEVFRISRFLFTAYDFPSITLDFRGKSGEMKLTTFLEGR